MPSDSPSRRPEVLLLAGEARDAWARSLAAAGLEVNTTGWLDGTTAARLRRPDAVLVSTDLPPNAPQLLCNGFRASVDLAGLPIIVAGPGADRVDQAALEPMRADHYVLASADGDGLADRVREAIRVGRVPAVGKPARTLALALGVVSAAAMVARLFVGTRPVSAATAWLLLAAIVLPLAGAFAVGVAARKRPMSVAEWRRTLGWLGLLLWNVGRFIPAGGRFAEWSCVSLGACAFAGWAWLGPAPTPWFPRSRRPFQILAGAFIALAAAPLVVWALRAWR
jgi:hypothetical protein